MGGVLLTEHLVLLPVRGLDVLAGNDGVVVDDVLSSANMRLRVSVELLSPVAEVEVKRVRPGEGD